MSSSLVHTNSDIARLLRDLPPGAHVTLAFVTLPAAASSNAHPNDLPTPLPGSEERTVAAESEHAALDTALTPSAAVPLFGSGPATNRRGRRHQAIAALAQLRAQWASVRTTTQRLRDWVASLELSERELRRAIDEGAIPFRPKMDGKDHGTPMISAVDLRNYLETIEAVESNQIAPPSWWLTVRRRAA